MSQEFDKNKGIKEIRAKINSMPGDKRKDFMIASMAIMDVIEQHGPAAIIAVMVMAAELSALGDEDVAKMFGKEGPDPSDKKDDPGMHGSWVI